jgi:hypothetical protein
MSPPIWDDIALAANSEAALEERRESLLRVCRPGHLIQAACLLPEDANLQDALRLAGSDNFRWITQRTFRGSEEAVLASLIGMVTLFAARQAERSGDIEGMRWLTLGAVGCLNAISAEEQTGLLRALDNVFASGSGLSVAAMLDSLGGRSCVVGPFRDMLGMRRDIVRPARVPVLFFHEGQRKGLVAWLHLEAVALGHGHAYPHPQWLALQPMDPAFRLAMAKAWEVAVDHVGAERVRTLDTDGHGRPVDLRWYLQGLPADADPIPLRGGSLSAALAAAMAAILLRRPIPDWWAISASVLPRADNAAPRAFQPVEHLREKVQAAMAPGSPVRVVQVHADNEREAKEAALAVLHEPDRVDRVIVTVGSLEETLRRMADHRQQVAALLAATGETHGPEIRRFLEEYRGSAPGRFLLAVGTRSYAACMRGWTMPRLTPFCCGWPRQGAVSRRCWWNGSTNFTPATIRI